MCTRELEGGVTELCAMDPQIVSVGIGRRADGYGYRVVRRITPDVIPLREVHPKVWQFGVRGIAVELCEVATPVEPLLEISSSSASGGSGGHQLPERARQRPLCAGLQVQNWDNDARQGALERERIVVGTLGMIHECGGRRWLLSNNHVIVGNNNAGHSGDRILQAGSPRFVDRELVARLDRFAALRPSPVGAAVQFGNVIWNRVDAAAAELTPGLDHRDGFVPSRKQLPRLGALARPSIGEEVFKVGRTTGLTRGRVVSISDVVGPVHYAELGPCWFQGSFTIESDEGTFSAGGDSGAVVVRPTGEVVGMIYAGNGVQTYACPIIDVLESLDLLPWG